MKNLFENQLIKKGVFALAIVAVASVSGLVYAATGDNTGNSQSGYGTTSDQATAAINKLNDGYQSDSSDFRAKVNTYVATFKQQSGVGAADADQFNSSFNAANAVLDQQMADAQNDFLAAIQQAASTAESKDQFIDRYNHLKADYFNQLDAAKNQFAAKVSNMGNPANVAKDQFMNNFNSSRDAYGNMLEQLKNDFAATISNL